MIGTKRKLSTCCKMERVAMRFSVGVWISALLLFGSVREAPCCSDCSVVSGDTVNLSSCGFNSINFDPFISCNGFRNAKKLRLVNNDIHGIRSTDFLMKDGSNTSIFWQLEELDLSKNNISTIDEATFNKLRVLKKLNLRQNRLQVLRPNLLLNKYYLEDADFSQNNINSIHKDTFTKNHYYLYHVNISHNSLVSMEPWPYLPPNLLTFDLSHNNIANFTNHMGWQYDLIEPFHATVDLRYNQLREWRDEYFHQYNRKNGSDFYTDFVTYNLDLRQNPWFCDCNIWAVSQRYQNSFFKHADTNLLEVYCSSPQELAGKAIFDDVQLSQLVCNITLECPTGCLCQDKPDAKMMHVNCDNGNHTRLPDKLPKNKYNSLKLDMNNNLVGSIDLRNYTPSITSLSLANNKLRSIDSNAVSQMTELKSLDFHNNKLALLPNKIQYMIRYENTNIKNNPFICDCNMTWMAEWINFAPSDNINRDIQCTFEGEDVYKIREVTDKLLNCTYDVAIGLTIGFAVLLTLVIIAVVWAKRCPYETKVIVFRFFRYHPWDKYKVDEEVIGYDGYISFDDTNIHIRQWVLRKFVKRLEEEKPCYRFFVPVRDLIPGQDKADSIIDNMERSKRVIIILSDKYDENEWCKFECQRAEILEHNTGRIIFIKYHPEAENMIENEPWKSRVKGRKIFSPGEKRSEKRWFWGKIKYELPVR